MPQTISSEYLAQLLRAIAQQRQTGLLRVEQVGQGVNEQGMIYFEGGRMFNARVGVERGKPAFKRISEWEHVIYTFQRINKPMKGSELALAPAREPQGAPVPPLSQFSPALPEASVHQLSPVVPQAENNQTRTSRPFLTQPARGGQGTLVVETPRPSSPDVQSLESAPLTSVKTALVSTSQSQSFILRGDTLETYVPAPPASMSQASQRWTTHIKPEISQSTQTRKTPAAPPLNAQPGENSLPGREAIFRASITITSNQAMQKMERRERIVFVLLDGRRTVQHIANLLHQPASEVGQVLLKLAKIGFAECVQK